MAAYSSVAHFKDVVSRTEFTTHREFLFYVAHATFEDLSVDTGSQRLTNFEIDDGAIPIFFLQAKHYIPEDKHCGRCGAGYSLTVRRNKKNDWRQWEWRGPQNTGCANCSNAKESYLDRTILQHVDRGHWMDWLSCFCKWSLDAPVMEIVGEHPSTTRKTINVWIDQWQNLAKAAVGDNMVFPNIHRLLSQGRDDDARNVFNLPNQAPTPQAKANAKRQARLNARAKGKAKAKAKAQAQRRRRKRVIVMADETYLNKGKRTRLSPGCRPAADKIWLWGVAVQDHPELF